MVEKSWKHLASTFLPMNELIALLGYYPERDHEKLLPASPRYVYAHLLIALVPDQRNDPTYARFERISCTSIYITPDLRARPLIECRHG